MNSRERVLTALAHQEPDRVPYDLAGTSVTGIHVNAYRNLCQYIGIDATASYADEVQQIVIPSEECLARLEVDTRGLFPLTSHNWNIVGEDHGDHYRHTDEWGFTQRMNKEDGFWWSQTGFPLDTLEINVASIIEYGWPVAGLKKRISGLREQAKAFRAAGKIVMLKGLCAGMFEMGQRVRRMDNFLMDMVADKVVAGAMLDKILELKIQFWEMALPELGDLVDIVVEADDYGTQESQLISYGTFKELIHPRLSELMGTIRRRLAASKPAGERGYIFFHSCGNVLPFLPDFIELGIDILNPVHINATGMAPNALKKEFGRDLVFWGGGVETQRVLSRGTPDEVREDVKRNLDTFMPGGGFVFNTVHNIQGEAPPENIMAMWETKQACGVY